MTQVLSSVLYSLYVHLMYMYISFTRVSHFLRPLLCKLVNKNLCSSHVSTLYFLSELPGSPWTPRSHSGRILVAFYWIFCIVMVATYTGNLTAFLAVETVTMPFNSLSEMIQQNDYTWGLVKTYAVEGMFRVTIANGCILQGHVVSRMS